MRVASAQQFSASPKQDFRHAGRRCDSASRAESAAPRVTCDDYAGRIDCSFWVCFGAPPRQHDRGRVGCRLSGSCGSVYTWSWASWCHGRRPELGLVGLVVVISVIWNLLQSQFMPQTIAVAAVLLAVIGTMAGDVWIEDYCRQSTGTACNPERTWRDSRNLAFLVFSMALVVEVLLDRFAKAAAL